jgi:hypothetical protein
MTLSNNPWYCADFIRAANRISRLALRLSSDLAWVRSPTRLMTPWLSRMKNYPVSGQYRTWARG